MEEATGEAAGPGLRVAFDRRLKLEFHGATVTSDAGLLAFRELDDVLGLTAMAGEVLTDPRTGRNGRHSLIASFVSRCSGASPATRRERCRPPRARSRDAVDRRGPCGDGARGVHEPDGPLRDERDDRGAEPHRTGQPVRALDRSRAAPARADGTRARHRQQREPDLRRPRGHGLQRALRVHLLSPALRVQPRRRSRTVRATRGQRAQRPRLARRARPGGGAVSRPGAPPTAARGCGLRPPGRVRVPGGGGLPVHDSLARQSRAPGADRPAAYAARGSAPRTTCGASTRASVIGRRAGVGRAESSRRWSGTPASCTRVSASS